MPPFRRITLLAAASALTIPAIAVRAAEPTSVPVPALVSQLEIPHTTFRLKNGLTVIVHEDHKAPIVAVSAWYNVGSKDEPKGKTGFAHLFEHIMYNGSENLPGDYFKYLAQIGATDYNGTTGNDRTNYFQTVPKAALERALFMESDRMGHLLGAVTQQVLDIQRGVVQNEKRQEDSRPGGMSQYKVLEGLFPEGHPYRHSPIGSMQDLDAASLDDVKQWFRDKYGPNNAVLVVAGDVTASEVRPLAEKYFGHIRPGPINRPAMASVPRLAAQKTVNLKDAVATTVISRNWAVPGLLASQYAALDVGASILAGLSSSRLDNALVRNEKIAVGVGSGYDAMQRAGVLTVQAVASPGADPVLVGKRLDEIIARLIADGPTEDEVRRAVMREIAGRVRGLEQVGGFGGKAVSLAEGQIYSDDSGFYKKLLAQYSAVTPAKVQAAMKEWMSRPALTVTISSGQREAYAEAKAPAAAAPPISVKEPVAKPTRALPAIGSLQNLQWPQIIHAQLSNGVRVVYAQRTAAPLTQVALNFDSGTASDPIQQRGLSDIAMGLLNEGAAEKTSQQIAEAGERLGANITSSNSADRSDVLLSALTPNLGASLDLLADVVQRPAFAVAELDRVRVQTLTGISQLRQDPQRVGDRVLPAAVWGANHPYGAAPGGDPEAIKALNRDDLVAWHQTWIRPDTLKIFVVSNLPLSQVQPELEQRFGTWATPSSAKGVKQFPVAPARSKSPRILLVDRPGAPQSTILAGQVLPVDPRSNTAPLYIANQALGGHFLSRLNMDLREKKGWSYGVSGSQSLLPNGVAYFISAPVQADKTGDAIAALNSNVASFLTAEGLTAEEMERNVASAVNELPGQFETSGALLSGMMRNDLMGRPNDFYVKLGPQYRATTAGAADAAIRAAIDVDGFVWVVVGDAATLRPQLQKLGMPVQTVDAP